MTCIGIILLVFISFPNILVFAATTKDTYTYEAPILNIVLGKCVTLKALTYFKSNESEIITWKRDTKPITNSERLTRSGKSLSISSVRRSDHAYYQVTVDNPYSNVIEVTDIWLNIKACKNYQKEEVASSSSPCQSLCTDKCPATGGWVYATGTTSKCLQYFAIPKTWTKASESCQAIGGELTTVNNRVENEFIGDMLQTAIGGWIGLNDRIKEADYIWNFKTTSAPSFYTWGDGEPSNYNKECNIENCVKMEKSNGKWVDLVCGSFQAYVCEVSSTYNETDRLQWSCYDSKCYRYFHDNLVWKDALQRCKNIDSSGTLATIQSKSEKHFIQALLIEGAWIGLNDIWEAGTYTWGIYKGISSKASFTQWDSGEPNDKFYQPFSGGCPGEDCTQIKKFSGVVTWHDLSCETKLPYVCVKIRDRAFSTGAYIGIVIGGLIFIAMIAGIIHAAYVKHKRTAVKDIIKAAYEEDVSMREKDSGKLLFRDAAKRFMPGAKVD